MNAPTSIRTVGIVVKPNHDEAWATACELVEWLKARDISIAGEPFCPAEALGSEEPAPPSKTRT